MSDEERLELRYDNYYNNYNMPYQNYWSEDMPEYPDPRTKKCQGQTLDGMNPCDCKKIPKQRKRKNESCPTGFKLCQMKMHPPPGNHPTGIWCATIQPCPPKPPKRRNAIMGTTNKMSH